MRSYGALHECCLAQRPRGRVLPPGKFGSRIPKTLSICPRSCVTTGSGIARNSWFYFVCFVRMHISIRCGHRGRDSDISPGHIPSIHVPPARDIPPPGQFPSFLHGVGHFPFHHHRPPVYNIKRSTVNPCTKFIAVNIRNMG